MNNKVLVQIIVPDIEESYDIFIPINKTIGNIIVLISKSIREISNQNQVKDTSSLFNRQTGEKYDPSQIIKNTNIRNGTQLILI